MEYGRPDYLELGSQLDRNGQLYDNDDVKYLCWLPMIAGIT